MLAARHAAFPYLTKRQTTFQKMNNPARGRGAQGNLPLDTPLGGSAGVMPYYLPNL